MKTAPAFSASARWPRRFAFFTLHFSLCTLLFSAPFRAAGLPLPDHVLYGTIALNGHAITRADTNVVVEARRALNGPVLASYRMGSAARLGDFHYELRLELAEDAAESPRAIEPGETLLVTVRNTRGLQLQATHLVTTAGTALRLDFGDSIDTNGDGVPEGWELATLGSQGADLRQDTDSDGAADRAEYVAGTAPRDADDTFRLALLAGDGEVGVSFRALAALGTGFEGRQRYYALESATDAVNGPWRTVTNLSRISGSGQLVEHYEPTGTNPPAFFRARVWLEGP